MLVTSYLAEAIRTLKPTFKSTPNPFKLLSLLNKKQWIFFGIAFIAWAWDAFDFFTASYTVPELAKTFDQTNANITWGISLVLMLRFVGAAIFGIASDRYGRKWPFVVNNLLFIVLELGTGFTQTYSQFLAVRALFGISMGGLYGNIAATALEDCPEEARGVVSGILQQGYTFGYLLCTIFSRALVNTTSHGWRPLYWFGACPPVIFIIIRLFLPETDAYLERKALRAQAGGTTANFLREGRLCLKEHWLLLIYLVLLMSGFNFMAHGSQDLYPTLLANQYNFSANRVTVTQCCSQLGALLGGAVAGYASQIFGRRFMMIVMFIGGAACLYPYGFVSNNGIIAAVFFEQFCVQGAWGIIPIHLTELSPAALRTFTVGTSYQIGNLVSSASATIEAKLGQHFPLPPKGTVQRYEYGKVMAIFMACVYVYNVIFVLIGPEAHGHTMRLEENDETVRVVGKGFPDAVHVERVETIEEKPGNTERNENV